jgi:hypothetical protein
MACGCGMLANMCGCTAGLNSLARHHNLCLPQSTLRHLVYTARRATANMPPSSSVPTAVAGASPPMGHNEQVSFEDAACPKPGTALSWPRSVGSILTTAVTVPQDSCNVGNQLKSVFTLNLFTGHLPVPLALHWPLHWQCRRSQQVCLFTALLPHTMAADACCCTADGAGQSSSEPLQGLKEAFTPAAQPLVNHLLLQPWAMTRLRAKWCCRRSADVGRTGRQPLQGGRCTLKQPQPT